MMDFFFTALNSFLLCPSKRIAADFLAGVLEIKIQIGRSLTCRREPLVEGRKLCASILNESH